MPIDLFLLIYKSFSLGSKSFYAVDDRSAIRESASPVSSEPSFGIAFAPPPPRGRSPSPDLHIRHTSPVQRVSFHSRGALEFFYSYVNRTLIFNYFNRRMLGSAYPEHKKEISGHRIGRFASRNMLKRYVFCWMVVCH